MDSMWASLPVDLLVEIFRLLDSAAVVASAGACRPWRRAIIGNASVLGPRPGHLLLGFFHRHKYVHHRVPGPRPNVLTATDITWTDYAAAWSSQATFPVASGDGLVLLAGGCRVIPAAALDVSVVDTASYALLTGLDDVGGEGSASAAVWILAVKQVRKKEDVKPGITYLVFSPASGSGGACWGPVKRSARLDGGRAPAYMSGDPEDVVVCRSCVYWLGVSLNDGHHHGKRQVAFTFDVFTERTWTTELPERHAMVHSRSWQSLFTLGTAEEHGRWLSLVALLPFHKVEVWVLAGDGRWTLRRAVDLQDKLPRYRAKWGPEIKGLVPQEWVLGQQHLRSRRR